MKNLKTITSLLLCYLFLCCSNANSISLDENQVSTPELNTWKLVTISSMLPFGNTSFNPGIITWTFNTTENTITVVNTSSIQSAINLDTGIYNYVVGPSTQAGPPCQELLTIEGTEFGCMNISSNEMVLSSINPDGFVYNFVK